MVKRILHKPRKPKTTFKIAICQYGTRLNDLNWNFGHAIELAEEAFDEGADYVILPEFSFCGMIELSTLREVIAEFEQIRGAEMLRRVARRNRGYLQFNHPALDGNAFWNETILLDPDGEIAVRYHKRKLAQIDLHVKFTEGRLPTTVDLPFGRVGFLICRDVEDAHIVNRGLLEGDTAAVTNQYETACRSIEEYQKADLVVGQLAFASWWTPTRRNPLITDPISMALTRMEEEADIWARHTQTYVALVNKSGFEHGHGFTGGSLLVDAEGKILAKASSGMEILYIDLPLDETGRIARPSNHVEQ